MVEAVTWRRAAFRETKPIIEKHRCLGQVGPVTQAAEASPSAVWANSAVG